MIDLSAMILRQSPSVVEWPFPGLECAKSLLGVLSASGDRHMAGIAWSFISSDVLEPRAGT